MRKANCFSAPPGMHALTAILDKNSGYITLVLVLGMLPLDEPWHKNRYHHALQCMEVTVAMTQHQGGIYD